MGPEDKAWYDALNVSPDEMPTALFKLLEAVVPVNVSKDLNKMTEKAHGQPEEAGPEEAGPKEDGQQYDSDDDEEREDVAVATATATTPPDYLAMDNDLSDIDDEVDSGDDGEEISFSDVEDEPYQL